MISKRGFKTFMRKAITRTTAIAIVAIVIVAVIAGVGYYMFLQPKPPEEFKIGILLPYTGVFAAVAKTQEEGILLAVDEVNEKGGLNMPWGKVKVSVIKRDDEANLEVGLRRFRELVESGVHAVMGQTWVPLTLAINNEIRTKDVKVLYFPVCVTSIEFFKKENLSPYSFATMMTAWSIGYSMAAYAIKNLGVKRIYFLARSDSWGWDMFDGVKAAVERYKDEYGVEIVGYDEAPLGTPDFTPYLRKVLAANPDAFMFAQFGADQSMVLKQSMELGLKDKMIIFCGWITNMAAKGIPPEALEGVYALHFFYWDMSGFPDKEVAAIAEDFVKRYTEKYGYPPDAYAANAYIATKELLRAVELAGTFDPDAVAKALMDNPDFMSVKGPAEWRIDHQPWYKYAAFVVVGKAPEERKGEWDMFKIVGWYGGAEYLYPLEKLGYK